MNEDGRPRVLGYNNNCVTVSASFFFNSSQPTTENELTSSAKFSQSGELQASQRKHHENKKNTFNFSPYCNERSFFM